VVILGSLIYLVEGRHPASGFTSIPIAMYWAVVTLTTVGYGDVAPVTPLGQFMAAMIMVVGYGIIAVPTGIVSVELAQASRDIEAERARANPSDPGEPPASGALAGPIEAPLSSAHRRNCTDCGLGEHDPDAHFCKRCGTLLPLEPQ
jgi:voltage-gated potassium channel